MNDRRRKRKGRLFVNAYGSFGRVGRGARSWYMRDAIAIMELVAAFEAIGFALENTIMNSPGVGPGIRPFDTSGFRSTDLIIQATRPPVHDHEVLGKKSVPRSYTSLEQTILYGGPFQTWFRNLNRAEIVLTQTATDLSPAIAEIRTQEYVQYKGSMYRFVIPTVGKKRTCGKSYARTAAYLVYKPHLWAGGPGYFCAFGLGAADTVTWCTQLATRFRHLLLTTPFAVAEMSTGAWPEDADTTAFAKDRPVTILGQAPMTPPAPSGPRQRKPRSTEKLAVSL